MFIFSNVSKKDPWSQETPSSSHLAASPWRYTLSSWIHMKVVLASYMHYFIGFLVSYLISLQNVRSRSTQGVPSSTSFSDDEDATLFSGSKSTRKGRKEPSQSLRSTRDTTEAGKTTGRGRGRGRGRGASTLKQTTLDTSMGFRHSQRWATQHLLMTNSPTQANVILSFPSPYILMILLIPLLGEECSAEACVRWYSPNKF